MAVKKLSFVTLEHICESGEWTYKGRADRSNEIFFIISGAATVAEDFSRFSLSENHVFCCRKGSVYQVYNAVKIPIVGMGGVSSAEDVIEMMLAGATAVQVGAANLVDPYACKNIIDELPEVMEKYRIGSLTEIIGGAH